MSLLTPILNSTPQIEQNVTNIVTPKLHKKSPRPIPIAGLPAYREMLNRFFSLADLSDFDAALGRARLTGFPESPSRTAMFDLEASDTEGSPSSSLEGRFDFPATPVTEDLSKQFLTMDPEEEDKMMKTAASEIAKSLDLPVRKLSSGEYNSCRVKL